MHRRLADLVLVAALVGCDPVGPAGLVDDTSTDDTDTVEDTDTGADDTAVDTSADDTATDTGVDTGTSTQDTVATCAVPDLQTLYPGVLPASPWAAWPAAPACIDEAHHDVIILLGCPSEADGSPSDCQIGRVEKALRFAADGYGDRFIVSGAAVANEHVEAESLRDLLVASGVAADHIELEPQARHSDENLYYSGLIMAAKGWDTALVISEPEHLWYTVVCDANCCVDQGRLSTFQYHAGADGLLIEKAATYVLYPTATTVSSAECEHIESPLKLMCTNMDDRQACADNFQL